MFFDATIYPSGELIRVQTSFPENCPLCQQTYAVEIIHASVYRPHSQEHPLFVLNHCPRCHNSFLTVHKRLSPAGEIPIRFNSPRVFPGKNALSFPPEIEGLSPRFVTIYRQAAAAEAGKLYDICGIAYRKALEHLIKDFMCHDQPDLKATILAEPLAGTIKRIQYEPLRVLAERCAWIGNDAAHVVSKHPDRDISDMRKFIRAMETFISAQLAYEDALSIHHASPGSVSIKACNARSCSLL